VADPALTRIRAARPDDVPALAALLAGAFAGDAVLDWILRPYARRHAAELFFARVLRDALPLGGVRIGGEMQACAIWLPPDAAAPKGNILDNLGTALWMRRVASPWRAARLAALVRLSEEVHPKAPCHYLSLIGTLPEARGRGLASALIGETLARADAEAMPAFLETADDANIAYYNRFGFELTGQAHLPLGGPSLNLMWRAPRSR
jgi:ribosomal protein S18 acetylase RimI-like enzyme